VEPHKLQAPGATPGPATDRTKIVGARTTTGYANGESGGVESAVILWVRLPPRSLILKGRQATAGAEVCHAKIHRTKKGLLVKREDARLATGKSGFDSPAVHSITRRACAFLPSPLPGEGLGVRGAFAQKERNGR
jgi:hypothetical protein